MSTIETKISITQQELHNALELVTSLAELKQLRVQFLGKKGSITEFFTTLKSFSGDERKTVGALINQLRDIATLLIDEKEATLIKEAATQQNSKKMNFDVTAYMKEDATGHLHPYTHIVQEIENIFISMGYQVVDGPEIENDYNNFTALNIPEHHPARDMYDTFWMNRPDLLLRTHTSTVQSHIMREKPLPIAAIAPGRCFRHEATDATHDFMFMQCEGFLIDKHVTLAHLFATAKKFLHAFFKRDNLEIRIRPGFFPFVEPGVEIDIQCPFCTAGCSVCKKSTWIEVFPGGLIHPNVLQAAGINPEEYSGFAFGFGLTRLAMIKYAINDIRLLHSGRLKFLEQF